MMQQHRVADPDTASSKDHYLVDYLVARIQAFNDINNIETDRISQHWGRPTSKTPRPRPTYYNDTKE